MENENDNFYPQNLDDILILNLRIKDRETRKTTIFKLNRTVDSFNRNYKQFETNDSFFLLSLAEDKVLWVDNNPVGNRHGYHNILNGFIGIFKFMGLYDDFKNMVNFFVEYIQKRHDELEITIYSGIKWA